MTQKASQIDEIAYTLRCPLKAKGSENIEACVYFYSAVKQPETELLFFGNNAGIIFLLTFVVC